MPAPKTAADLYAARTALGLTKHQLADHIDASPDAVTRWETGTNAIPIEVAAAVHRLTAYTNGIIDSLIDQASQTRALRPDLAGDVFSRPLPGAWRNTVLRRVASRLGG